MEKNRKTILLLGPTASGKTAMAVTLAAALDGEIIGVDSRQVYRGLDIGSGKDLREYTLPDGRSVPHHLIDIVDPMHPYSLAEFLRDAYDAWTDIRARGKVPVFAGGTALYVNALLNGYNLAGGAPDAAEREYLRSLPMEQLRAELSVLEPGADVLLNEPNNRYRLIRRIEMARAGRRSGERTELECQTAAPEMDLLILGAYRTRSEVRARIERRLDERLEREHMLDEARRLHDEGVPWERLEFFGLEYRQMALHLQGACTYQEMRGTLLSKIHQFAKRQDSWFRKMERDGFDIHWFAPGDTDGALTLCRRFLSGKAVPAPAFRLSETYYGPVQER